MVDWVPVFQFFLFTVVSTPPNFLCEPVDPAINHAHFGTWLMYKTGQEFLESSFPATVATPTPEAVVSASASNDKELDREAREGRLVEQRLNTGNTLVKFVLDQSIGAAVNTILFSVFMHSVQAAMAHRITGPEGSAGFLASGKAIDYSQVDWKAVVARSRLEFMPIMRAGWKLWPFVSLFNFVLIRSVVVRNLVGSLAGVVWGVYMSLFASR